MTGQDFAEVISYNDWSLNSTKHEIYVKISQSAEVQYLLVTRNVEMNDEAIYECQAGGQRARAKLTVTGRLLFECQQAITKTYSNPVSILRKSISGRHRPVRVADGPMAARCRFT